VVGTALAPLPPAPPKAGSRGAEMRDEVDSREAREPGRRGDDGWGWSGGRPVDAAVVGKGCAGDEDIEGSSGGDGVRIGEDGSKTGASRIGSGGAATGA
jgi:hypothetical protein